MPEVYTETCDLVNPGYTHSTRNVGSLERRFADLKSFQVTKSKHVRDSKERLIIVT